MRIPPFRRASIASGYTPTAIPGRYPGPQPLKEKGASMQREKKTEIITLRVTPQVKERIRAKAQELSLTVTDYLCLCGLGKKIVRWMDWIRCCPN